MKNELYHHGTKGMRWGVRKQEETFLDDPALATSANKYKALYNSYRKIKALCVSGKAKKKDVQLALEKAKIAAIEYRRLYKDLSRKKREDNLESQFNQRSV